MVGEMEIFAGQAVPCPAISSQAQCHPLWPIYHAPFVYLVLIWLQMQENGSAETQIRRSTRSTAQSIEFAALIFQLATSIYM